MRITLDSEQRQVEIEDGGQRRTVPLYSPASFEALSRWWVKVGWALRYSYAFSWMGRPIIQLPEDVLRIQEVIYAVRPDILVETGVAHGGSLILYASLFKALGKGRVVGVDIEIRPHNRAAIEGHPLGSLVTLLEGDSTDPDLVALVRAEVSPQDTVMVVLDSDHSRRHVLRELNAYAPLVTPGSYIVATDGIMHDLADVPGGRPSWSHDNPLEAARQFAAQHPDFALVRPPRAFNESGTGYTPTYWPEAYLQRRLPGSGA